MRTDPKHVAPGTPHAERTGTINHLRLTVSDIARAKAFYHPVMERLGYLLVEESRTRLASASSGAARYAALVHHERRQSGQSEQGA
ncbi:hypothetical protein ACQPTN_17635 [Bradyrhizobium sp. 13971]